MDPVAALRKIAFQLERAREPTYRVRAFRWAAQAVPAAEMTDRMVAAVSSPHADVLGHCTGRIAAGRRPRPESAFDADRVFAACREHGVAVEINCRPERQDPPDHLLTLAAAVGCLFAIDTDAHAPGQLDWLDSGCERAECFGITADRIINTRTAEEMISDERLRPAAQPD